MERTVTGRDGRGWRRLATACALAVSLACPHSLAQPASGRSEGQTAGPTGALPSEATAGGRENTTVVPRSSAEPAGKGDMAEMTLEAFLTDDGQRIEQGLIWRVFKEHTVAGKPTLKMLGSWREASPRIRLARGEYIINVAFGRAYLTRMVKLEGTQASPERFVLNVGGLRVNALAGNGEAVPEKSVSYDVFSGDTDQLGDRRRIVGNLRPGVIVRLNAGIYHIVSTYGDANVVVKADLTVEAGKLTEATVTHPGAKVTFKLVTRTGGEALADTQWSVLNMQGELVKESVGALPTHILGPGPYVVTAKHNGRSFRRSFSVEAGEAAQIEVIMQ